MTIRLRFWLTCLTIEEHVAKPLNKVKVVFCGDIRNNMAYAWMYGCAKMGMHFVAYGPKELADQIDQDVIARAREVAEYTGATIEVSSDEACLKGADVLYTDIWASMGEEDQIPERVRMLTPFKVTKEMLDKTENGDVIFMHCLPSFHDFDTTMAAEQKESRIRHPRSNRRSILIKTLQSVRRSRKQNAYN